MKGWTKTGAGCSCGGLTFSHPSLPLIRSPSTLQLPSGSFSSAVLQTGSRWPPLSMALSCCDLTAIKCQIKVMGRHCRSAEAHGTQWIIVMERMMSWLLTAAPSSIFICIFKIYILYFISVSAWDDLTCVIPLQIFLRVFFIQNIK